MNFLVTNFLMTNLGALVLIAKIKRADSKANGASASGTLQKAKHHQYSMTPT
jgi:hypothetical protein